MTAPAQEFHSETAIAHHLTTACGYVKGDRDGFELHRSIFPADLLAFIKATQPDDWAYLEGIQKAKSEETLLGDLCRALQGLVQNGFLTQDGQKRWATYRLRDEDVRKVDGARHLASDSTHKGWDSSQMLEDMEPEDLRRLKEVALQAQMSGRLPPDETRRLITELCRNRFLTAAHLGELMNRNPEALRGRFLKPMVAEGVLRLRYPDKPNRPDQAYTQGEKARP